MQCTVQCTVQAMRDVTRLGVAPRAAPCAHQRCLVRKGEGREATPHRPVTTRLVILLVTVVDALTAALVAALAAFPAAALAPCGADARQRTHIVTRVERVERWQQIVHLCTCTCTGVYWGRPPMHIQCVVRGLQGFPCTAHGELLIRLQAYAHTVTGSIEAR